MLRRVAALVGLGLATACAAPVAAGGAWEREELPAEVYWAHDVASAADAEAILLHRTIDGTFATVRPHGAAPQPTQQLDSGWNFYPTLDASRNGGAVAAWYDEDEVAIQVAERPAEGGPFAPAVTVPGGQGNYTSGVPFVRVNERGDAIVVYLAAVGGLKQVRALYRPAGGEFGEPEDVGLASAADTVFPRDVALAPDGTAVVGFLQLGRAHVAVRPPDGPFGPAQALGGTADEWSWQSPRVGIDAAGDVVAAWLEMGASDTTGPVRVAFRRAGEPSFGTPHETGMRATDLGRILLAVSAPGEVLLVVEAATSNPDGQSSHLEGLHAAMGNALTATLGPEEAITDIWGSYPALGMNARGDAFVTWDWCCPLKVQTRVRDPREGFGPEEDVQPPIEFEGWRGGIAVRDADVDERGNARVTYEDFELDRTFLATAAPFATSDPPAPPPLGDHVAPVLAAPPPDDGEPDDGGPDDESTPVEAADGGRGATSPPVPPPPPPPAPPPPPTRVPSSAPPPTDRTAPGLTVRIGRRLSGGRLPVRISCSERCTARLTGTFAGRRLRPSQIALAGGRTAHLRLPFGRKRRRGMARLAVVAVDAAGNTATRRVAARVR